MSLEGEPQKNECYICRTSGMHGRSDLISPCECKGSISHVHRHCLEEWLDAQPAAPLACTVCNAGYVFELMPTTRVLVVLRVILHVLNLGVALFAVVLLIWNVQRAYGPHGGVVVLMIALLCVALTLYMTLACFLFWVFRKVELDQRIADRRATWVRWFDKMAMRFTSR